MMTSYIDPHKEGNEDVLRGVVSCRLTEGAHTPIYGSLKVNRHRLGERF